MKKVSSWLLISSLIISLFSPAAAADQTRGINNSPLIETVPSVQEKESILLNPDVILNDQEILPDAVEAQLGTSGTVVDDVYGNLNSKVKQKNNLKPKERIASIQSASLLLKKITAYFYPSHANLLSDSEKQDILQWSTQEVNQQIALLSKEELELLDTIAPVATEQFDYHTDRKKYLSKHPILYSKEQEILDEESNLRGIEKLQNKSVTEEVYQQFGYDDPGQKQERNRVSKKTSNQVTILSSSSSTEYKVTEFKNNYNYKVNTDDLVDPIYRSANHVVTDVELPGKPGLDIVLTRKYNSLESKILNPEYRAIDNNGYYVQSSGNMASAVNLTEQHDFIATGWTLNIPIMRKAWVSADVNSQTSSYSCQGGYQNTGVCYETRYYLQSINGYEKIVFTLDNGSSYEFRNGVIQDYPYSNVSYTTSYNSTTGQTEYHLTLDDQLTYTYNGNGQILRVTNQYGDQVTYVYNNTSNHGNQNITITDSYGRNIVILKNNNNVITGIKVTDGTTTTKEIQYNVTQTTVNNLTFRKWTNNGYTNVTESIPYYQLLDVKDVTDQLKPIVLESYEYYTVDSTKLADFNFKGDNYKYRSNPSGEITFEYDNWYWTNDNQILDSRSMVENNKNTYGEVPYLLLKQVNYFNGLSARFNYTNYNTSWYTYTNPSSHEEYRGTTKLYQDKFAVQYVGYHPVERVDYIYTDQATGLINTLSDYYQNHHYDHGWNWNEYWKSDKQDIPRLRSTSRFGHKQTIVIKSASPSAQNRVSFNHYAVNGKDYSLFHSWVDGYYANHLDHSDNGTTYTRKEWEGTAYEYSLGHKKPKAVHAYVKNYSDWMNEVQNPYIPESSVKTTTTYQYDNWGYIATETDALGNTTTYEYNGPFHGISKKTSQSADSKYRLVENYTYFLVTDADINKRNQLSKVTTTKNYVNPTNNSEQLSDTIVVEYQGYDATRQPTRIVETSSGTQYGTNNVVYQEDITYTNRGYVDTQKTKVTTEVDTAPKTTTLDHDYYENGLLKRTLYPDLSYVEYTYDPLDRVKTYKFQPVGAAARTHSYDYDDTHRKVTMTLHDGEKQETYYSPFGLALKQTRIVNGVTRVIYVNVSYDGETVHVYKPFGQDHLMTTYAYDPLGRMMSSKNAIGQTTVYFHANAATINGKDYLQNTSETIYPDFKVEIGYEDQHGREVKFEESTPSGKRKTTINVFDSYGNVLNEQTIADGQTRNTWFGYDSSGNLIFLKDDQGTVYRYVYNRSGLTTAAYINDKLLRTNNYNELGWLLSKKDPAGNVEKQIYKPNGMLERFVDKSGQSFTYEYTPYFEEDRVSVKNSANQEVYWKKYTYDPVTRMVISQANSEGEEIAYRYDQWKRLEKQTIVGKTYTLGYDNYDRLNKIVYPDAKVLEYRYDNLNRIQYVLYPGMNTVEYQYSTNSDLNQITLLYSSAFTQKRTRDAFFELKSVVHTKNSGNVYNETYTYDGFGNVKSISRNGTIHGFEYDSLNRIKHEYLPGGGKRDYTYDDRGNRLTLNDTTNQPFDLSGSHSYSYNPFNQLKTYTNDSGVQATYTYYADGMRASKTVNGDYTRYIYVNGHIIEELDRNGNTKARNIWGNELLYRVDNNSNKSGYYYYNGHGDVIAIKDANGNTLNSYDYDLWGNVTSKSETMSNPFGYTGEVHDTESKLIYLRARYYDPSVGRFLTEDSYEGLITDPLSLNLYTYAENNPLIYQDPSGHVVVLVPVLVYVGKVVVKTAVDTSVDYAMAKATGQKFDVGKSVRENAVSNIIPGVSEVKTAVKVSKIANNLQGAQSAKKAAGNLSNSSTKGTGEVTQRQAMRDAKRAAGIPTSQTHTTHKKVRDKQYEDRTVYEFDVNRGSNNKGKKYVVRHDNDKNGRGSHYHGADDTKGDPMKPGRYKQYPGHFPEDPKGFKKKGR